MLFTRVSCLDQRIVARSRTRQRDKGRLIPTIQSSGHNSPPILIGGNGRRLLSLAAREADILGFSGITFRRGGGVPDISGWRVSEVDKRIQLVRDVAGERYARLELNSLVQRVVITDYRRQAAEELASRWTQLSPEEILQSPYVLIGTVDQLIEDLQARRKRWGISYYVIFEPYVDAFAPVIARLAGR